MLAKSFFVFFSSLRVNVMQLSFIHATEIFHGSWRTFRDNTKWRGKMNCYSSFKLLFLYQVFSCIVYFVYFDYFILTMFSFTFLNFVSMFSLFLSLFFLIPFLISLFLSLFLYQFSLFLSLFFLLPFLIFLFLSLYLHTFLIPYFCILS